MNDQRQSTIRRNLNDMFMRGGEVQESKFWGNLFKGAGFWLLVTHAETVLKDWAILATLLVVGIAPDLLKKIITLKMGGKHEETKP